jgi:hypothetical protein
MKSMNRLALSALVVASLSIRPGSASADEDTLFGVRAGYYTEAEGAFVGAELLFRLAPSVYFNPNFEYVFVDNVDYFTANADFHYDFPSHGRTFFWAGAGLALVRTDPEGRPDGNTDAAANFLLGVGLSRGPTIPYLQAKVIAKDNTEFALAFGLRF